MDFPVMAENPVKDLQGQIPSPPLPFNFLKESNPLNIMKEGAYLVLLAKLGEKFLAVMTEWGVADIMPQGNGLNEVLIQPQQASYGTTDFRNELDVQYPVGDVVVLDQIEDLGFIYVT
jgi:hypothetical protein